MKIDLLSNWCLSTCCLDLACCRIYAELYKFFFHPFTTISYSGSVFMTVGITIER